MRRLASLADSWIGRARAVDAAAVAAVAALRPAVVVTGGSSGIGLALAQRFAATGETVVLVARDGVRLAAVARSIAPAASVDWLALDVTQGDAFERLTAGLRERGLYLDVLVNNAGLGLAGDFAAQDVAGIDALVQLNMAAPTRLMRAALPDMLARGRGGILNVASLGGYAPGPGQAAYYASKAYLISLSEAVAAEVAGRGVRVTVLAPGPVDTQFHARMGAQDARYRWMLPALSAEATARAGVSGYRLGWRVVVPGLVPKVLMLGQRLLPHPVLVPVVKFLLGTSREVKF